MLKSLQSQFVQAEKTLGTSKYDPTAVNWPEKIRHVSPHLDIVPPQIKQEVLEAVQTSVLHSQQLEVVYHTPHDPTSTYKVLHPLGLVQRGPITYLIASTFNYPDFRTYALHRISHARNNHQAVKHKQPITLEAYIDSGAMQFNITGTVLLQAWVSKKLADYLKETKLSLTQQLIPQQNGFLLSSEVQDSWQLRWWLLSQGAEIEVIKPEKLRQEISSIVQQLVARYSETAASPIEEHLQSQPIKFWKIAPGESACHWQQCYTEGYIVIGWNEYGSIKHYDNFDDLLEKMGWHKARTCSTLWDFANTLKVGDIVIASKGRYEAVGLGIITSDYHYYRNPTSGPTRPGDMNNLRYVKWLANQTIALSNWDFDSPTVCDLGVELGENLMIGDEDGCIAELLGYWGLTVDVLNSEVNLTIMEYERNG